MRTPSEYTRNLKQNIITSKMLEDCLFSVNKRAKNYRDQKNKYHNSYFNFGYRDKYGNEERNREKMNEMYDIKERLLDLLQPVCIHREAKGTRIRYEQWSPQYKKFNGTDRVVNQGCYMDYDLGMEIDFLDIIDESEVEKVDYYLFYELGEHSFHSRINAEDISLYPNLEVKDIGQIKTFGKDIEDLISCQFVSKVLNVIDSGNYTYLAA